MDKKSIRYNSKRDISEKCNCDLAGGMCCQTKKREIPVIKKSPPTTLMVMRHSERVDELFRNWIPESTKDGYYKSFDINMPRFLPIDRPAQQFNNDTPLTITGYALAQMMGKGIRLAGLKPDIIYCSPATRCLQTATAVRHITGSNALLRVEPQLFEDTWNYVAEPPLFPSIEQQKAFPVDNKYKPMMQLVDLDKIIKQGSETIISYNQRIEAVLQKIANQEEIVKSGSELKVLVVGHASTVDMGIGLLRHSTRYIMKKELQRIGRDHIPFSSIAVLERQGSSWQYNPYRVPPATYHGFCNKITYDFVTRTGTPKTNSLPT